MVRPPDVSILVPTFNRAAILTQSLGGMTRLEPGGLSFELVIVDNNSKDETPRVVESFKDRLPIRYLFEEKAGKSQALNLALQQAELGTIVVFADDDIVPRPDWLTQIQGACERHRDFNVFGGKIELVWPEGAIPGWAQDAGVQFWALGLHDLGNENLEYPYKNYPGGANYWVRGEVLSEGHHFDTAVGPRPKGYGIMETETSFLHQLALSGHKAMYIPEAAVGHLVQSYLLESDYVQKRAVRWGRGMPHRGLCHTDLLDKSPLRWKALRYGSLARHYASYATGLLAMDPARRMVKRRAALTGIGYDLESLRIAKDERTP